MSVFIDDSPWTPIGLQRENQRSSEEISGQTSDGEQGKKSLKTGDHSIVAPLELAIVETNNCRSAGAKRRLQCERGWPPLVSVVQ